MKIIAGSSIVLENDRLYQHRLIDIYLHFMSDSETIKEGFLCQGFRDLQVAAKEYGFRTG